MGVAEGASAGNGSCRPIYVGVMELQPDESQNNQRTGGRDDKELNYLPMIMRVIGNVRWVITASLHMSRAFTVLGMSRVSTERTCSTKVLSMKLLSAPESMNTWMGMDS